MAILSPIKQNLKQIAALLICTVATLATNALAEPNRTAFQQKMIALDEWRGSSSDAKHNESWKLAPPNGVVVGPKAWEWLWKQWQFAKELPKVDFEKELVLVAAGSCGGNTIAMSSVRGENGDLQCGSKTTLMAGPGFVYVIQKLNRGGIKSVNGQPIAIEPKKEEKTGFVVGGKNDTTALKKLPTINDVKIADLEKKMRPAAISRTGFLGADENLLDVLAADNTLVVDQLGLTHQELARHMQVLAALGNTPELHYLGRKFKVTVTKIEGFIESPFADGTKSNANVLVQNLDNGKNLRFSLLVPLMIERYGFYEGFDAQYRVDPRQIMDVFDFLGKVK